MAQANWWTIWVAGDQRKDGLAGNGNEKARFGVQKSEPVQIIADAMLELGARLPHIGESLAQIVPSVPRMGDVRLDATTARRYNVASYFLITKTVVVFINRKTPGLPGGNKGSAHSAELNEVKECKFL
ncbi:hypothetical protein [Aeromonas taiwanensis]|uniref:hypothetical protein n=1 Tax=Aeromonas taiwanensis TaxID=633417 RepID=UPI003BA04F1E